MTYMDLVNSFRASPREIPTVPITRITPKWFYVYVQQDTIFASSGRNHANACYMTPDRRLDPAEFSYMLDLYQRRKAGAPVSQEARRSLNQSYWFGVFKAVEA